MKPLGNNFVKTLRHLPRAALLTLMLAVPVLVVPSIAGQKDAVIEAPKSRNSGAGFVLLMSLRRG